jgi:hypothetical protein
MNAKKLTTVERRANEYCQQIAHHGSSRIVIEWKKSRTWGSNPVIEIHSGKCCNVSGCGYCKESTALADVLCFLFEPGSMAHNDIRRTGGAGVSSVVEALRQHGWTLEKIAGTKTADVYDIRKT